MYRWDPNVQQMWIRLHPLSSLFRTQAMDSPVSCVLCGLRESKPIPYPLTPRALQGHENNACGNRQTPLLCVRSLRNQSEPSFTTSTVNIFRINCEKVEVNYSNTIRLYYAI